MYRLPPRSTGAYPLLPYTTLSRSGENERAEQAYAISGRALFPQRARLCRPYRSGNVEMRPFHAFLDKALDELRGRYRPAITRTHILHVCDLAFDLLVIGLAQRNTPQQVRPEERREGNEGVSQLRSGW